MHARARWRLGRTRSLARPPSMRLLHGRREREATLHRRPPSSGLRPPSPPARAGGEGRSTSDGAGGGRRTLDLGARGGRRTLDLAARGPTPTQNKKRRELLRGVLKACLPAAYEVSCRIRAGCPRGFWPHSPRTVASRRSVGSPVPRRRGLGWQAATRRRRHQCRSGRGKVKW